MSALADDPKRLRGATRWSMAARCARMAAFGLFGEQPVDPSDETRLQWARGKMDETWWIENVLEPRVGRENIVREKPVPWPAGGLPIGELHTDAFVVTEKRPYEIKSHFSGEPMETDFVQLCGQMHFDPDCEDDFGVLVTIDRDLHWEALPVMLTAERVEQVEAIAAEIVAAGQSGELPERVCQRPSDGRSRLCPFVAKCFAGREPPDALDLDGETAQLALEAHQLDMARKQLKPAYDLAEAAYKEKVKLLNGRPIVAGVPAHGDGVSVKKTLYGAHEEFSLKKARLAGLWTAAHDELFGPFMKLVGEHFRYSIDVVAPAAPAAAAVEDFGDEAPWTDDDLDGEPEWTV